MSGSFSRRLDLGEDLLDRDRRHHRQRGELPVLTAPGLRQVGGPDLEARSEHVLDEGRLAGAPVAGDDHPARRVDLDRAHPVVGRLGAVLAPGQHLERPEPQEEDGEDGERDEAEDGDAEGELRRQPVRLLDPRVGGQEPARPGAVSQGGAPRGRGRGRRPAGRTCGRSCRPARSGSGSGGRSPAGRRGRPPPGRARRAPH